MAQAQILYPMFMSKIPLQAFKIEYVGLMSTLITPVVIIPELNVNDIRLNDVLSNPQRLGLQFNALWDTGAHRSCIKPEIAQKLGINNNIISYANVTGVNSETQTKPIYKIGYLVLSNRVILPGFHFIESNIASTADILIGMDLILLGDLSISNGREKTVFCFSMPPHDNVIDLVERGNKVNQRKR